MKPYRVMFICTGNICRSPLAHAVFQHLVQDAGLEDRIEVDSSGTHAHHLGEESDSRMRKTAAHNGLQFSHKSRRLVRQDLEDFDMLLTMDRNNHRDTMGLCIDDDEKNKVHMFRNFDIEGSGDVPDPWYGGIEGFEEVWHIVERTCRNLFEEIRREIAA